MAQQQEELSDSALVDQFEKFLREFNIKGEYVYYDNILALSAKDDKTVLIQHTDLPENLQDYFFRSKEVETNLKILNKAVQNIYSEINTESIDDLSNKINAKLSIDDQLYITDMKKINIDKLGKLVVFDSTIISLSEKKSAIKDMVFECKSCNTEYETRIRLCTNCDSKNIGISISKSKLVDFQIIDVQERQDNNNSVPVQFGVKLYSDLVGKFKPGDNVRITGIVKLQKIMTDAQLARVDDEFSNDMFFDVVIEAHNIQILSSTHDSLIEDPSKFLTPDDIKDIHTLRNRFKKDDELIKILINSFAYWIFGHTSIKETLLYQIVGSVPIKVSKYNSKRPDIHVFLIGDPGTTKTQLLKAASRFSINGVYTNGKGSSGVGLTAALDRDKNSAMRVKVGAAVLADKGLCAVDEFLTINEDDRKYLLECMESGMVSINKGGINMTLNARTTFLMACNPEGGKYNRYASLKENVPITDQLFSRFDIIHVITDTVNKEMDNLISDHIISLYDPHHHVMTTTTTTTTMTTKHDIRIDDNLLYKYLVYAKTNNSNDIKFTKEAIKILKGFYHELRRPEKEGDITATPRQLEGCIRLSIARARLLLKNIVDESDATAVIELLTKAYSSCGLISLKSGSMNLTSTYSMNLSKMNKDLAFMEVMLKLTDYNTTGIDRESVEIELVKVAGWDVSAASAYFDKAKANNKIYQPTGKLYYLTQSPPKLR